MSYPEPLFAVVAGLWLFSSLRKYVILLVASNVALCVRLEGNIKQAAPFLKDTARVTSNINCYQAVRAFATRLVT